MAAHHAPLQFVPFSSAPDISFWRELGRRKLDEMGLSDDPTPVNGWYEVSDGPRILSPPVYVDSSSFRDDAQVSTPRSYAVTGTLVNTNTLERFMSADKNGLMEKMATELREEMGSPTPLLNRVVILTFADLKSHKYYYWFGFPALAPAAPFVAGPPVSLEDAIAPVSPEALSRAVAEAAFSASAAMPYFTVRLHATGLVVGGPDGAVQNDDRAFEVGTLSRWSDWCRAAAAGEGAWPMVGFADPAVDLQHPGWPLRNLLMWVRAQPSTPPTVTVICWRQASNAGRRGSDHQPSLSIVLKVRVLPVPESGLNVTSLPKAVGWERNVRGKLGARMITLQAQLDPRALAEQSVDLNLRLMRWRLLPELDTGLLSRTRCLVIGAGTLGCNVARTLLGWGVRHITFVDAGSVSHSNPVRQSLFTFADCTGETRRAKATAAAEAIHKIFPGAQATGVELMVPMPGHPVADAEAGDVRDAVGKLESLVAEHDAVFLLTDTRESRWLPSLLCAAHNKLTITTALGFDSYVVMRHGTGPSHEDVMAASDSVDDDTPPATAGGSDISARPTERLGCYFCNDVVAPTDSMKDRTLDQQCTVTRPGLSMMASAVAVEMLVSLMHHSSRQGAPADSSDGDPSSPLGLLPHQVRGFLPSFRTDLLHGRAFNCCVACSPRVLAGYKRDGFNFLLRAFRELDFLEEFTGLRKLQQATEWDGDDEFEDDL